MNLSPQLRSRWVARLWLALSVISALAGTLESQPARAGLPAMPSEMELRQALEERGLDPKEIVFPRRMTDEMKVWAHKAVLSNVRTEERLRLLVDALLMPDGLGLQYEASYSGTAQEVFERRTANCLGFSNLLIAMSRELGIETYYLRVSGMDRFARAGDLIVVSDHVTVGYPVGGATWNILEFTRQGMPHYRTIEPLSDLAALALYYSNRGAELLSEGDNGEALEWLELGVVLGPESARAWTNLGVAKRRSGDLAAAASAYRQASEIDPNHAPAYSNLLAVLRFQGRTDAGKELIRLLKARRSRNPFVSLALGDLSLEAGRLDEARTFYRRGVTLARGNAEPLAAMGQWWMAAGQVRKAEKWLQRAEAIDADGVRVRKLRREIYPEQANG